MDKRCGTDAMRMWKDAGSMIGRLTQRHLGCSFCGRKAADVERLVAGPSVYICDGCVAKCVEVLQAHGGFEPAGASS
jgi:ATP-dependent Clp protease ATP-binding subunit ClpX